MIHVLIVADIHNNSWLLHDLFYCKLHWVCSGSCWDDLTAEDNNVLQQDTIRDPGTAAAGLNNNYISWVNIVLQRDTGAADN